MNESKPADKSCLNCHFLAVTLGPSQVRMGVGIEERTWQLTVEKERRESITQTGFHEWARREKNLRCHQGVWEESRFFEKPQISCSEFFKDREDTCFFFPFKPGMELSTAAELERREEVQIQAHLDREHGITLAGIGLIGAIAAGVITAVITWFLTRPPPPV